MNAVTTAEREFFRLLLELYESEELDPHIERALAGLLSVTGADAACTELIAGASRARRFASPATAIESFDPDTVHGVAPVILARRFQTQGVTGWLVLVSHRRREPFSHRHRDHFERMVAALLRVSHHHALEAPHAPLGLREETRRLHELRVAQALERNEWNVARAARDLKVTRSLVYDVARAAGLKRD